MAKRKAEVKMANTGKASKRARPDKINHHAIESEGLPSASGFDSEFRCPGKRALCKRLPLEDDTAITLRGTRIHKAMEEGDFSLLCKSDADTASRIAYGESEIVHEYGFEGALVEFEQRAWDTDAELNHVWSARVDRHDWQPKERRLLVIDDKTGFSKPPPVKMNWQVRSSGSLLAEQYDAKELIVALIHPHHPDSLWEAAIYSREESDKLLATTRHLVQEIQKPNQPRIPGGIQCQFCPAKRICPEFKAAEAALDRMVDDWIKDEGFTAINRMSKTKRAEVVRALKERQKNIKAELDKYLELMKLDPDSIAGWRLSRKLLRKVTNEQMAVERVKEALGEEVVYACLKFSVPSLETEIKRIKGKTAKEAQAEIQRILGSVLKFEETEQSLTEARSV